MGDKEGVRGAEHSEAGRQAAVLANQHFIFPVNTCTDVTVHFLTLGGTHT